VNYFMCKISTTVFQMQTFSENFSIDFKLFFIAKIFSLKMQWF